MNRIDKIHIHNFKFFQAQEPISLGGNHMLLYGENGSGKSSLYWALYTLFEASLKAEDDDIKKYFSKVIKKEDCLVNIHAPLVIPYTDNYDSFIEVTTDDDPAKSPYKISVSDVAIRGNADAKFVNYASDFINYRMLLGLSSFRHSDPIDLFNLFVEDIFKYVQFAKVEITREGEANKLTFTNAFDIWKQIELGMEIVDSVNSTKPRKIRAYKYSEPYNEFLAMVNSFNASFQKLLDYINIHGPNYFKKLGYDFTYELSLQQVVTFYKGDIDYEVIPFILRLKIPEYESVTNAIDKPHSFLNEAKLSAIAISIRLAILSQKLKENCLKFIVLDDLLISLDMSNREKVLEVFLSNEFSTNYQLIILTHDFSFFQLCKKNISDVNQKNWVYYELYVDEDKNLPVIVRSDTSYTKACNHLKKFDYPAAGNYFRKAAEEIFENDFPREITIADNGDKRSALKNYLEVAINFYERIGHSTANLKTLDNYLFLLLNPLSHRAVDTNVYKIELNRVKSLLPLITQEVKSLNFREIIAANNVLVIHFRLNETTEFEYFIKTAEPIYLFNNGDQPSLSNSKCKSFESSTIINGDNPVIIPNEHYNFNNLLKLHKQIFKFNNMPYDNSHRTNIYHQAQLTNNRQTLQQIVDSL